MKKATKIVVAISLAMIILGSGLATISWAVSGGDIGVTWSERGGFSRMNHIGRVSNRLKSEFSEPGAFQSINVETDYGDVKLIPGNGYRVEYSLLEDLPPVEISVVNGTLTVRNRPGAHNFGLNFNLFGSNRGNALNDVYIRVYYPADAVLTNISISSDFGEVDVINLNTSGTLDIDASLGSIKLEQAKAGTITINADMGSVTLNDITANRLTTSLAMGELTARNCAVGDTEIENDMGAVELTGDIAGNVDISCTMGSVDFRTSRPRTDYFLDLVTDLGSVEVDGQRFRSGDAGSSSAPYLITVTCDMGSADLRFGQ